VTAPGSTRPVALIRIGLAVILWTTWGGAFLLYKRFPSPEGLLVAFLFFLSTTLMVVGYWSRLATLLAGLSCLYIYYGLGHGDEPGFIHHHTALMTFATCLLALTPCGGSLSIDRWLAVRRAARAGQPPPPEQGDLWAVKLLCLLVSMVYLGAAISKSHVGWLSGDRFEMLATHYYLGSDFADHWLLERGLQLLTIYIVALEWCLTFGLWSRRARPWLIPQGILLHWGLYVLLPVATFSLTMVLLYLAFLSPSAVHRTVDRLMGHSIDEPPLTESRDSKRPRSRKRSTRSRRTHSRAK
jgi:hypothetical protein